MNPLNPRQLQKALRLAGYCPGKIDGIIGPKTRAATSEFQKAKGMRGSGIPGPKTYGLLREIYEAHRRLPNAEEPFWMDYARRYIGEREVPGPYEHNPHILRWLEMLKASWRDDETPWCGTYMGGIMRVQVPDVPLPGNPFGARQWLQYGEETTPRPGAILVFWRKSPSSWAGHVGFYVAEDATHLHVLGGNQGNSVNIMRIAKDRLLGARWPTGYPQTGGPRLVSPNGLEISTNEA